MNPRLASKERFSELEMEAGQLQKLFTDVLSFRTADNSLRKYLDRSDGNKRLPNKTFQPPLLFGDLVLC